MINPAPPLNSHAADIIRWLDPQTDWLELQMLVDQMQSADSYDTEETLS